MPIKLLNRDKAKSPSPTQTPLLAGLKLTQNWIPSKVFGFSSICWTTSNPHSHIVIIPYPNNNFRVRHCFLALCKQAHLLMKFHDKNKFDPYSSPGNHSFHNKTTHRLMGNSISIYNINIYIMYIIKNSSTSNLSQQKTTSIASH